MKTILFIFSIIFFNASCNAQTNQKSNTMDSIINRKPIVAGQFYTANATELKNEVSELFKIAKKTNEKGFSKIIISPHAGYVFSGEVAASAYNQIDSSHKYDNIFIIASSHRASFGGVSVYNIGNYETPIGEVKVNTKICNELISKSKLFSYQHNADALEHSIEVQLPFLQYLYKEDLQIVPIVIGTQSPDICKEISNIIKPYFSENNLFVISTDFSHYPTYEDAQLIDKITANTILQNSSKSLIKSLNDNDEKGIKNLSTSLCGWSAVLTMLYITENNNDLKFEIIDYKNSGDNKVYGDKKRVVGYYAIRGFLPKNEIMNNIIFTENEKQSLLSIARNTITNHLKSSKYNPLTDFELTPNMKLECGAFVTLHKKGKLRGCIGRFTANQPLYKTIQDMAIASATQDHRFNKVDIIELEEIDIEISVLTPLVKINSIDEFILGKHGIYIKKNGMTGTFLPQVATQTGWTKEEFLGHCAQDKAGIGWDGWKSAELYIYEAIIFGEKD